jgi:hypothetical protein
MTGRYSDAVRAVNGDLEVLDSGSSRVVYIDRRRRYVYKVEDEGTGTNVKEMEAIAQARLDGYGKFIPPATLFFVGDVPVIAMPYYPRDVLDLVEDEYRWAMDNLPKYLHNDWGVNNMRATTSGRVKFIDLGYADL